MDEQRCVLNVTPQSTPKHKPSQGEAPSPEQEQFFKMISHAQGGRMDEQRCSLQPSRSTEADTFFNIIASSQGRRLDDQRVSLPTLPGISGNSEKRENAKSGTPACPPKITVAESTPTTPRKGLMTNAPSGSPRVMPKSASFTPETEYQKNLNSAQVNCSPRI
uniref:Uncharacterized protein n=1 Tax=Echeneis naucrates TaxID=173247 RepID=A0A665WAF3_ECHNA